MKKSIVSILVLAAFLAGGAAPAAQGAENVTVTLPTFPVTLNGCQMTPEYDEYPVIVYKDITYFPMTYHYAAFLGLATNWADYTLTVKKTDTASQNLRWYERTEKNKMKQTASLTPFNIVINGELIDNSKEQYPLLLFRDITYFPLTWRFAVDEFGWDYAFDMEQGLQINSKLTFVKEDQYITSDNITVGFPDNSWNEQYNFAVYQNGEKVKTFSLKTYLLDGEYYFNEQVDENGYMQTAETAKIENNTLFLPCVRQSDNGDNIRENVLLEINLDEGTVGKKTKID